jgi:hypothetical protein
VSLPAERHPTWAVPEAVPERARSPRRTTGAAGAKRAPQRPAPPAPRVTRSRGKHHVGFAITAAVLLGPMLLGIAGLNALLAQQSFRLDAVEQRIASLASEHRELVHERARLSAPGRIAAWARRMGMRLPDDIRPLHTPGEDQAAPAGPAGDAGEGA